MSTIIAKFKLSKEEIFNVIKKIYTINNHEFEGTIFNFMHPDFYIKEEAHANEKYTTLETTDKMLVRE